MVLPYTFIHFKLLTIFNINLISIVKLLEQKLSIRWRLWFKIIININEKTRKVFLLKTCTNNNFLIHFNKKIVNKKCCRE